MAQTKIQCVEPSRAVELVLEVGAKGRLASVVVLLVALDKGYPVVVGIGEVARRVIYVRTWKILDLWRSIAIQAVLVVGHGARGHQDVVIEGGRVNILTVKRRFELAIDLPVDVTRIVLGALFVRKISGFILEIKAITQ